MHAESRICKTAWGISQGLTLLFKCFNEKITLFFSPLYTL